LSYSKEKRKKKETTIEKRITLKMKWLNSILVYEVWAHNEMLMETKSN